MKKLIIVLIIILPILHSCMEGFDWNKTKTELLTDKNWDAVTWNFSNYNNTDIKELIEETYFSENLFKMIFHSNGKFEGYTPDAFRNGTYSGVMSGNWTFNESSMVLIAGVDTFNVIVLTDSTLSLQLSKYQSISIIVVLNQFGLGIVNDSQTRIIWNYVNTGEVDPID